MQWLYWFIAIILSAGAGYWVYRRDKKREVPYPWLTAALRSIVVLLTLLLLIAPYITISRNETQKPVVLFLQDNSQSIARALGKDTAAYQKNALALLDKLSGTYRVVRWGFGHSVQADSLFQYKQTSTDIAAALAKAQEFYGAQNLGAVILATDGRYNEGNNPAYQQLSFQNPVYTVGLGDSAAQKDLRIANVYANKIAALNSQFEIRADVLAQLCDGYNNSAQLSENGNVLSATPVSIHTDRFDRSVSFSVKAAVAGLHHYVVSIPATDGEVNTTNNRRDIFVEVVDEKKNILLAAAAPHPDINAIREALSGMDNFKLTIRTADNLPASFDGYDMVILYQLPGMGDNVSQLAAASHKPVWYIVGTQNNFGALASLPKPANINVNPGTLRDVFAGYNSAFSSFTLPQNLPAVLDKMPPLNMPVGSVKALPNTDVLFRQRSGEPVPLWMLQQGVVPAAMLVGEGIWRCRLYEYKNFGKHEVIDECIRQTVSFLTANNNEKPFRVVLPKYVWSDQEAITLDAYLLNANNEQVNTADVQLSITDSAGKKQAYGMEKNGSAYRINIGVRAGGSYTYHAQTTYNGKTYTASGSFVVESMPLEFMETGADFPLLYSLAKKYGGSFVPASAVGSLYDSISKNTNIKPLIQTNAETVPLVDWKWYFFLVLLFAVAEWLLRKYWLAQ